MWRPLLLAVFTTLLIIQVSGNSQKQPTEEEKARGKILLEDIDKFNSKGFDDDSKWDLLMEMTQRNEESFIKDLRRALADMPEGPDKRAMKKKLANLEKMQERFTNKDKYKRYKQFGTQNGFDFNKTPKN